MEETLPSEILLDAQPSGTSVSSKDGQGRQLRAPPTQSKETRTPHNNGEEILLSEAPKNHALPENTCKLSGFTENNLVSFLNLVQL